MGPGPPEGATTAPPGDGETDGGEQEPLSVAERAAAFATGQVPVDRAAALRAGSAPVPRRFVRWVVVGFAILGVGGVLADHFVGNVGVGSTANTTTTLAGTGGPAPPTPAPPSGPPVGASLNAFIGLTRLAGNQAPPVSLRDQHGARWALGDARGKVIVLAFFNAACDDICPVLADEIAAARAVLGPKDAGVEFAAVNTDPRDTSPAPVPPSLGQTGLVNLANVVYLNGPLSELNTVWSSYGVTVTVQKSTQVVTHTDVMYFIGPTGKMTLRATPFANEDRLGAYSLAPDQIQKFGRAVADAATSVLGSRT
jgi:cytochrome oxidase Cu insertion factor (SCO1/SenC/PrrC family)